MRPRLTALTALASAAALIAGAGCGSGDPQQAREVARAYVATIADRDFEATCDLFTAEYRRRLGGTEACREVQAAQYPEVQSVQLTLGEVFVKGDRARVNLLVSRDSASPSPLGLLLVLTPEGEWRIRGQR